MILISRHPSMMSFFLSALVACFFFQLVAAHMSIFTPAMYGWMNWPDDPQSPLVNLPFDQWWFRGYMDLPTGGQVEQLTAGGVFTAEIACNVAWTKYGARTSELGPRDACPSGDNAGPYHSSLDPTEPLPDINGVSGCALAIADVDDVKKVTMNDLTVFSVNHTCVYRRETDFQIPAAMPKCSGSKCICVWLWLANYGQANFYMTGFDCAIVQSQTNLPAIGTPQRALWTGKYEAVSGPKLPIYAYNDGSTAEWFGNDARPGYHASYGFQDGAQDDIFTGSTVAASASTNVEAGNSSLSITQNISAQIQSEGSSRNSEPPSRNAAVQQRALKSHRRSQSKRSRPI